MTNPKQALQARYIYDEAIAAGWVETPNFWQYPVVSATGETVAERLKKYPYSTVKGFKYGWHPSKPDSIESQWYILPKGYKAIRETGVMIILNGEPALLAAHAGGVDNVGTTTLSEVAFPKDGVNSIRSYGASRVIYIADKDAAGLKGAINWRDSLAGSGIDFEALQLPADMPDKSDVNDVLIAVAGDKAKFQAILKSLEPLPLPAAEPKKQAPKLSSEPLLTPQGLIDTIANALNITEFGADGFSRKNILCPFHDDKAESAGFNRISGVLNCFTCGSHSPRDTAEKLGIDWKRFYPQKESKPKKAKPVRQIETIAPIETITETQIFHSEMSNGYATAAYPAGQYIGWIDQEWLPMAWVRAMLTLCHSKSATVVYAMRFHRAVRTAKINPENFTIDELMQVLGGRNEDYIFRKAPRKSTQNFIDTMTAWGFFRIFTTMYLDTNMPTKSGKNLGGRPKTHYAIMAHTESLRFRLAELLEPALLEVLTGHELAPRSTAFRDSLDLDLDEYRIWYERTVNPRHEWVLKQIADRVCEILEDDFSLEFTDFELEHPANLRGKLLRMELSPYSRDVLDTEGKVIRPKGIQLSRGKLALQLGCSESSMTKLYKDNHVGVERIRGWVEVDNPNNCDILAELREAPMRLSKELGGFTVGIRLKVYKPNSVNAEYLQGIFYGERAVTAFHKWDGHIEKLYIFVEQPSLLWLMNEDEIAQKAALVQDSAASTGDETETQETGEKEQEKTEKKERKKSLITGKDRIYVGLSPEFQIAQLALEVHKYTLYKLVGLSILDNADNPIYAARSNKELVMWLNRNANKKAIRSEYSFYSGVEDMAKESKAVIYYIHCEPLNKTYVGSSQDIQADIKAQFATLNRKKHDCKALQAAFNEFGKDSLQWGVLEEPEAEFLEGSLEYWRRKIGEEKPFAVFNPIID